jgi:NitT/TauT family transport system substrate-binding protein
LQREWTANAEFAGDVWAEEKAPQHGIRLTVKEGSEVIDPVKVVRSGEAQFGIASADRILRENERGADLLILATSTYKSPVVFLSHPKDNIRTPRDFIGKRVGIQSGTNTELVLKSLLRSQHLDPARMKIVESGWGTATFQTGDLDVLGAFDYDEPVQLELKGIPVSAIRPEEYGVHYVGTVYFTRRSLAQQQPALVQAFINSLVDGWRSALADPHTAIAKLVAQFKDIDSTKETKSLLIGREYFEGENGKLLYASPMRWQEMADNLKALGLLRSFDFNQNVDYRFLETSLSRGPRQ